MLNDNYLAKSALHCSAISQGNILPPEFIFGGESGEKGFSRLLKKSPQMKSGQNLECADNGGALDFLAFRHRRIQSAVALRLPAHSKCFSAAC
jgi:hypothetical protein